MLFDLAFWLVPFFAYLYIITRPSFYGDYEPGAPDVRAIVDKLRRTHKADILTLLHAAKTGTTGLSDEDNRRVVACIYFVTNEGLDDV